MSERNWTRLAWMSAPPPEGGQLVRVLADLVTGPAHPGPAVRDEGRERPLRQGEGRAAIVPLNIVWNGIR